MKCGRYGEGRIARRLEAMKNSALEIGIISGYFNPIHTGHLDYMEGARKKCEVLYVIVNNDHQVELKGSTKFLDEKSRVRIVEALSDPDFVTLSIDEDETVVKTLKQIWEENKDDSWVGGFIFMNGGDRKEGNTPEVDFCEQNGIEVLYNVGGGKTESSSSLLKNVRD
tara:strand:- start:370 stop:873 length:504 start_codon:yes stop_codon:yes gene_type:complete